MKKLRIFYASDTTPNALFDSNLWRNNLYLPLVDLGHDVTEFKYDLKETFQNLNFEDPIQRAFIEKNRLKVTKELLRQIKVTHEAKPVDLFFSYFTDSCVLPEAIDEIRDMGIKTVNWYCNGSYLLNLVEKISPHYDWCLVPEKFRLKDYRAMGARPIYCQEAANPNIYKPYNLNLEFDVTFVGQAYGDRPACIKYLLEQGVDVRVWGWGWGNFSIMSRLSPGNLLTQTRYIGRKLLRQTEWQAIRQKLISLIARKKTKKVVKRISLPSSIIGGILSDEEMIRMYSRSKINLGFSSCGYTHETEERILQIRLRDFEVPMSGGFYIVEYMEELEEFFDVGKEIVCYTDKDDLVEKVKYYLKHKDERECIRQAGYKRCISDHTWHNRFNNAFHEMELL